jgi:hypothetical protein
MKTKAHTELIGLIGFFLVLLTLVMMLLTGCSSPTDPTFIQNAAAAMHGGIIQGPDGAALMSPGMNNGSHPHPFFNHP